MTTVGIHQIGLPLAMREKTTLQSREKQRNPFGSVHHRRDTVINKKNKNRASRAIISVALVALLLL